MTKTPGLLRNRCKRRPSPPLDAMPFGGLATIVGGNTYVASHAAPSAPDIGRRSLNAG